VSGRDEVVLHPNYARFLDMVAKSGEHFGDYLLIVKTNNGILDWRSSDKTWALGAAQRFINLGHAEDEVNMRRSVE
jgi:hypothetical protein